MNIKKIDNSVELDQFYTKPQIAKHLYDIVVSLVRDYGLHFDCWLEPSAGTGSFYKNFPANRLGIDLEPKMEGVLCEDFFNFIPENYSYITIGNPPFGKNSSIALKFLNKASLFSDIVAFVLPKTFKKDTFINKVHPFMHIIYEEDLPLNSFMHNGKEYNVPCVFQVWKKDSIVRECKVGVFTHPDFEFTTKQEAKFGIQRVGANAGRIKYELDRYSPNSHYFIKASDQVLNIFEKINWSSVKHNTAGNPSISKSELINLYERAKLDT